MTTCARCDLTVAHALPHYPNVGPLCVVDWRLQTVADCTWSTWQLSPSELAALAPAERAAYDQKGRKRHREESHR